MAKLIIITREELEASHLKLEKLLAEDPHWKEQLKQNEHYETQVKKRHDAEYAAKRAGSRDSNEEAE